jgi:aminotransferase in exopolysaccharide biosynthesis
MKEIPNCIPHIAGNEIAYLKECIDTGWISSVGPFVDRFEKDFASYHKVELATAVVNGTAAIHLGLLSLGVRPGDSVLSPTVTFIGSVNPIKYLGAEPIFLDVDPDTLNLSVECLDNFLRTETKRQADRLVYKRDGSRISALIVVHLYGNPADMDSIMELSDYYGFSVLEDAAESLGARYKGRLVGTIGDVGCFSFNGNKVITSGGGGMIISRNSERTRWCKHLSTQSKSDSFEFIHDNVGFNYRLSNLCAAVGVAQMERLDEYIKKKRDNAECYRRLFAKSQVIEIISPRPDCFGTYWMSLARIRKTSRTSGSIIVRLRSLSKYGVGVRPIWYPIHKMPLYQDCPYIGRDNVTRLYQSTFCLPSSVGLTEAEIEKSVKIVLETFK